MSKSPPDPLPDCKALYLELETQKTITMEDGCEAEAGDHR